MSDVTNPGYALLKIYTLQKAYEMCYVSCRTDCITLEGNDPRNISNATTAALEGLKETAMNKYYESDVMRWLACAFNGSLTLNARGSKPIAQVESIHKAIQKLIQIGADSVEGAVWRSAFNGIDGLVLFKTAKSSSSDLKLYHEYFVAFTCLNRLREVIPSFMYIYGAFTCSPPQPIKQGGKTVATTFCEGGNATYLMLENIPGGLSLRKAATTAGTTSKQLAIWMCQIVSALDIAYQECGFVHNDLHDENVLMRPLPSETFVPISKFDYVRTSYIPTIIDYGRATVNVEGLGFGYYQGYDHGISVDDPKPEHDLYKIVGFVMYSLLESNPKLFAAMLPMLFFFKFVPKKLKDLRAFMESERDEYFTIGARSLPKEQRQDVYVKFGQYMFTKFQLQNDLVNENNLPPGSTVYNRDSGSCSPMTL